MAKAKKTTSKLSVDGHSALDTILWNCRVALRSVGTTEKNRDAVISLVFLKFASSKFEKQHKRLVDKYGDKPDFTEDRDSYLQDHVFFIPTTARWEYIVNKASENDIANILDDAFSSIEAANTVKGMNNPLDGALPKKLFGSLGADKMRIKTLIDCINQLDESRFCDEGNFTEEDLIGHVYEYFLRIYAASGKKEDGEFYTPACVVYLIAELLEPYSGTVYDPCCGSGGMFVQSLKFVERHKGNKKSVFILGQEQQPETWRLCKMNLAIRGIHCDLGQIPASTFTKDQHPTFDGKIDFVMANPPFNLKGWRSEGELTSDSRFEGFSSEDADVIPPASNANYAWILHIISKLNSEHGIAGFLLANGALNAGKSKDEDEKDESEYFLRKEIIKRDLVEAIIVLPRDMFYTTDISVTLWIINMNKKGGMVNGRRLRDRQNEILFVDLRRWDQKVDEIKIDQKSRKKKTILTHGQIAEVKKIYNNWQSTDKSLYRDVPELCRSANIDEIRDKDYSLAPSKYIEFIDHDLDIDYAKEMKRIQKEMREVLEQETQAQNMLKQSFKGIGYGIE